MFNNKHNPSAPPLPNNQENLHYYPQIKNYVPGQFDDLYIVNLEQEISNVLSKYKHQHNTTYDNMIYKITKKLNEFKNNHNIQNNQQQIQENNSTEIDKNFEKFEQNFKLCQYFYSKGQKELFDHINIIKNRKKELEAMRRIPQHLTRKVFDEIQKCKELEIFYKKTFEHKYGKYHKFKAKIKNKEKEENKLKSSYKSFMNKYS
tara:strand:- start:405 stop:1016 length:612 start_codon:yes stop_codon:yes gene_type:complete